MTRSLGLTAEVLTATLVGSVFEVRAGVEVRLDGRPLIRYAMPSLAAAGISP